MGAQRDSVETIVPLTFMYNYRVGEYLNKYIDGLAEKKLLGVKCPKCERVIVPPRSMCGKCNAHLDEWVEVGPEGVVENFTEAHVKIDAGVIKDLDEPVLIGQIRLTKADSLFSGVIKGISPGDLKTGAKVKAVWKDEPKGKINDLDYFEPV